MYESWQFLRRRGIDVELLDATETASRFPQFAFDGGETCVFDPWAGYLESGRAVRFMADMASELGVRLAQNTPVIAVDETADGVRVQAESGGRGFDAAVVPRRASGSDGSVPSLAAHVRLSHQQMVFVEVDAPEPFAHGAFPMFTFDPDQGGFYGFPLLREGYLKIAEERIGPEVDADLDRAVTAEFTDRALDFLRRRIPEMARGRLVGGRSCLYANTPDDHFFIDRVPGADRVFVAGGGRRPRLQVRRRHRRARRRTPSRSATTRWVRCSASGTGSQKAALDPAVRGFRHADCGRLTRPHADWTYPRRESSMGKGWVPVSTGTTKRAAHVPWPNGV